MKLGEALQSLAEFPGQFCAREVGWKKLSSDATGYGQYVLIIEAGKTIRWVAWSTYDNCLTEGGVARLGVKDFNERNWGVVTINELPALALESLNPLEKSNLARKQGELIHDAA